jgi:hypothetical protein
MAQNRWSIVERLAPPREKSKVLTFGGGKVRVTVGGISNANLEIVSGTRNGGMRAERK